MAEADLLLAQAANIRLTPQEDYEAEDETRVTFVPRVPAAARKPRQDENTSEF